ncbi:MAG: DUF4625 domain-containing protein [Bacteroidaceae bacterium]|nr:DUF4625 domain-containing protein [Bacteroidaceae bacterium]
MKRYFFLGLLMALICTASLIACGDDDEMEKDMEKPVISDEGITALPSECQQYHRGEVIPFHYIMTDNQALGTYTINIHDNFDHHTRSTSATECPLDEKKEAVNPWVFNKDFDIPEGLTTYDAFQEIQIPTDKDTGDYHFVISLTDKSGWQQIRSVAIKILE